MFKLFFSMARSVQPKLKGAKKEIVLLNANLKLALIYNYFQTTWFGVHFFILYISIKRKLQQSSKLFFKVVFSKWRDQHF